MKVPKPENVLDSKVQKKKKFDSKRINLIVDISKNVKAQNSDQYKQALVRINIDTLVKSMNFLIAHDITTPEDFIKYKSAKINEYEFLHKDAKRIKSELITLSEKIKFTQNYKNYRYKKYKKEPSDKEEAIQYKAALLYFERNHLKPETMKLNEMFEHLKLLKQEKTKISAEMKRMTAQLNELQIIEKNIESALHIRLAEQEEGRKTDYSEQKDNRKNRDYSI